MKDLLPFEKTDREIIVRKEGKTNPEFGCDPNKRKIEELTDKFAKVVKMS